MKLISWNVNGIRAVQKKGFQDFIIKEKPDILCVQETKAHPDQIPPELLTPDSMQSQWSSAKRKGYSGVATFFREDCREFCRGIQRPEYDDEGRFMITDHGRFLLYNIYFPNGSSSEERHLYKMRFLEDLNAHLKVELARGRSIIVVGDYNVAHSEIDIFDPIGMQNVSGFLPDERAWFDRFLDLGFIDTFRHFHPAEQGQYTWWSYMGYARFANRGWRLDYICISKDLLPSLASASILKTQMGSDHCPVVAELNL